MVWAGAIEWDVSQLLAYLVTALMPPLGITFGYTLAVPQHHLQRFVVMGVCASLAWSFLAGRLHGSIFDRVCWGCSYRDPISNVFDVPFARIALPEYLAIPVLVLYFGAFYALGRGIEHLLRRQNRGRATLVVLITAIVLMSWWYLNSTAQGCEMSGGDWLVTRYYEGCGRRAYG